MEATLVATKPKAYLELKHGYCSQNRKDHDSFSDVAIVNTEPLVILLQSSIL